MHGGGGGSFEPTTVIPSSPAAFGDIFSLIAKYFKTIFVWLDAVKIIGSFSLLDIIIVSIILEIIIGGLFVTFNISRDHAGVSGGFSGNVGAARVNAQGGHYRFRNRGGGSS